MKRKARFLEYCAEGDLDQVKNFIKEGLDPNFDCIYDDFRQSPISMAAKNNRLEVVKYLMDIVVEPDLERALAATVIAGHLRMLKYFVSRGADVDHGEGFCIRHAVRWGHFELVKYLVSLGADITIRSNWAVQVAGYMGWFNIVEYLIERGADITDEYDWCIRENAKNKNTSNVNYIMNIILKEMKQYTLLLLLNKNRGINKDLIGLAFKLRYIKRYKFYQGYRK